MAQTDAITKDEEHQSRCYSRNWTQYTNNFFFFWIQMIRNTLQNKNRPQKQWTKRKNFSWTIPTCKHNFIQLKNDEFKKKESKLCKTKQKKNNI